VPLCETLAASAARAPRSRGRAHGEQCICFSGYPARVAIFDFICLDCGEAFMLDMPEAPEAGSARCPHCDSGHARQTFESYLRNALGTRREADFDELRSCHFG
jgi:DNA-directed RNA polymerase subunit RPC12/RpoP